MTARARLSSLVRHDRGATMVEFGILAMPLMALLMVMFDLGYSAYLGGVVEGALHGAARRATVGTQTGDEIDAYIRGRLNTFQSGVAVTIDKKSYSQFSGVGKDEKFVDSNGNGRYDEGVDCYFDDNGNGRWDMAATSGRAGLGGSDDLVLYSVRADFPRILPIGKSAERRVEANMVLRNQPFGSQAFPECRK